MGELGHTAPALLTASKRGKLSFTVLTGASEQTPMGRAETTSGLYLPTSYQSRDSGRIQAWYFRFLQRLFFTFLSTFTLELTPQLGAGAEPRFCRCSNSQSVFLPKRAFLTLLESRFRLSPLPPLPLHVL